jgi:hypothetical protein
MKGQGISVFTVLCIAGVGLLFSACPSVEQRQATYHLLCTRESQVVFMGHGQVYSEETIKTEIDKRYSACMKYYAAQ